MSELVFQIADDIDADKLAHVASKAIYEIPSTTNQWQITSKDGLDNWDASDNSDPEAYCVINNLFKNTYIHELINRWPEYYNWRIMGLNIRHIYSVHRDGNITPENDGSYTITFSKRIHIPIITNPECFLIYFPDLEKPRLTEGEHRIITYYMKEGHAYSMDASNSFHTATNLSNQSSRYHLIGETLERKNVKQ